MTSSPPGDHPAQQAPVSVLTIFYDEDAFLAEAVESALAQVLRPLELVLIDNGSTPACRAVAERLAGEHPGIVRLIAHPDGRARDIAATRRLAIEAARGEYVGFLDADDVWLPGKLREQVAVLGADPRIAMVYGRTEIWRSWDGSHSLGDDSFYPLGLESDRTVEPFEALRVLVENRSQMPTTCNALIRRAALRNVLPPQSPCPAIMEDQEHWALLMAHFPVYVSSRVWARYRQRPGSLTAKFDRRAEIRAREQFLHWLKQYLAERQLGDRPLNAALDREIRGVRATLAWLALKRAVGLG